MDHIFARVERVERDAQLLLEKSLHDDGQDVVAVRALTLGYLRDVKKWRDVRFVKDLDAGVGVDFTGYGFPRRLDGAYGESPVSLHAFLRLRWDPPQHEGHAGMAH